MIRQSGQQKEDSSGSIVCHGMEGTSAKGEGTRGPVGHGKERRIVGGVEGAGLDMIWSGV